MKNKRKKQHLHPIMVYVILIVGVIIISGFLSIFDFNSFFYKINNVSLDLIPQSETINSLFNMHGFNYILSNTVSNFSNFTVLSNLIIILMGISILDKSGFLQTTITLTTKKLKKKTVTFIFVFLCILSSFFGNLSYLIFIPLGALLFFYGKRNPIIGVICSYAALTIGSGINILFTGTDSNLLSNTILASQTVNTNYTIANSAFILIMLFSVLLISYIITIVTENIIVPKIPKYEFTESELEEDVVTKNEEKGMVYACLAGLAYIFLFIYNIIPGLPLSGAMLDNSQVSYIDKLFSANSFFSNGLVFIITLLFVILGFFYGIGAKTIKNNKDFCDYLGHSLDGIGNVLVYIFFASFFISVFKESNIGNVIVAYISNLINTTNFVGIPLLILIFVLVGVATLFVPNAEVKWLMLSPVVVPVLMNTGVTPEFSQIIYKFADATFIGFTPLFTYFIVYLSFLEKYNQNKIKVRLFGSLRYQIPYVIIAGVSYLLILIVWYLTGLPLGINSFPTI